MEFNPDKVNSWLCDFLFKQILDLFIILYTIKTRNRKSETLDEMHKKHIMGCEIPKRKVTPEVIPDV